MNAIIGITALASVRKTTDEQREYLHLIKDAGESLVTLINDILDFSKIESGKLSLEAIEFDLQDSLGDILKTLASRAHEKRLELAYHVSPEIPEMLIGDPGRLRQVIVNLSAMPSSLPNTGRLSCRLKKNRKRKIRSPCNLP